LLGIDTGGTYTDAVLLDDDGGVAGSAKALTTKHDLAIGIREALAAVMPLSPSDIQLVSMSTTLATNAVVEGQGSPVCLILIGYDPDLMADINIEKIVPEASTVYIEGGHTSIGREIRPLDLSGARDAVRTFAPHVDAFAVSGYFGVRNPDHEIRVRQLVREMAGKPVTCGHELTTQLHAPRRAVTVAMNARLIPLLDELILTIRRMLGEHGIDAPLMVVKGDGSLVRAEMALERPVETILSGPAASVVGASYLADIEDAFVVDMGGTTTDIAAMVEGRPVLNSRGATIDGWQIMIEAIDARTTGLGGDSEVRLDERSRLRTGPQRVIPLSLLADQYPGTLDMLQDQLGALGREDTDIDRQILGQFVLRQRRPPLERNSLTDTQLEIWRCLEGGPVSLLQLLTGAMYPPVLKRALNELISRGLVVRSGFTPTDAVHVLGLYRCWSLAAAEKGAALWAERLGVDVRRFCERTVLQVREQMGRAIFESALAEEKHPPAGDGDAVGQLMIDRALGVGEGDSDNLDGVGGRRTFSLSLNLNRPIIAIGAPVESYMPAVSQTLNTQLCIPEHAEIDNALGAAVAGVVQTVRALIQTADDGEVYKVHLPHGVSDFRRLEEAVAYAETEAGRAARAHAQQAGADDIEVHVERRDRIVRTPDDVVEEIYIDTEVVATAVGRPRLG